MGVTGHRRHRPLDIEHPRPAAVTSELLAYRRLGELDILHQFHLTHLVLLPPGLSRLLRVLPALAGNENRRQSGPVFQDTQRETELFRTQRRIFAVLIQMQAFLRPLEVSDEKDPVHQDLVFRSCRRVFKALYVTAIPKRTPIREVGFTHHRQIWSIRLCS